MSRRKIIRGKLAKVTIVIDGNKVTSQHPASREDKDITSKTRSYLRVRSTRPGSGKNK